ncbi:hypothetical protein [Mycolicibacterium sediminis]|uniref:Uncharacterized protein n=1 Tax=Mycolicibacterium sediminis TaxID=1286180 RepID=A0A7I7QTP2_9MYCO|nr:hypothetical protein [Mycolicibacterium sediminis]BBY29728.1 hypothetical protein MSEDJ_38240 [Mycolicibacterium sediminis]
MSDAEHVARYTSTRRQLRGVAESLIAGPQYRSAGTIRLAVRPDGFAAAALPLAVHGADFTWQDGSAALAGPVDALAAAAGLDYGPPAGVYALRDPMPIDTVLTIDPIAAELVHRSLYAGGFALTQVLPDGHPVLWPEHFDVACAADEVNYGVSAGDDTHPMPYAYVAPWNWATAPRAGDFWNAPFGAAYTLDLTRDVDALAADIVGFLTDGRSRVTTG